MQDSQDIKTNPNLVEALGYYIKNKRLQKKIGLREMAERLNISPAYLSNLEAGKHSMTNPLLLKKISKIFEVDHLKIFKIMAELKEELFYEILDGIPVKDIEETIKDLMKLSPEKISLVKQYIEILLKT